MNRKVLQMIMLRDQNFGSSILAIRWLQIVRGVYSHFLYGSVNGEFLLDWHFQYVYILAVAMPERR